MPQILHNSVRLLLTKPTQKIKKTGGILIVQNEEGQ